MHVKGLGSGEANKGTFLDLLNLNEEHEIGEAIEEDVIFVVGNGSGVENDVGNPENKPKSDKPMFFFGQAGCLKLSPIKHATTLQKVDNNLENNVKTSDLFKDASTIFDGGQSSKGINESQLNCKNTTNDDKEFEKTNQNDVDVVKITQMPNVEDDKSTTEEVGSDLITVDLYAKSDTDSKGNETTNSDVVSVPEKVAEASGSTIAEKEELVLEKTEPDLAVDNDSDVVTLPSSIPSDECLVGNAVSIEEKFVASLETLPEPIQLDTTSHETIIQDVHETSSERSIDPKDDKTDESGKISVASTEVIDQPTHSKDVDAPIKSSLEPAGLIQPTVDSGTLNVSSSNSFESNKDIDIVPELKTENVFESESESAVKSNEITSVSCNDLVVENESTHTVSEEDQKNESFSNDEAKAADIIKVDEMMDTSKENEDLITSASEKNEDAIPSASVQNAVVTTPENEVLCSGEVNQIVNTSEPQQSLETSTTAVDTAVDVAVSQDKHSSSFEQQELNSCDSKVESLTIDSGSCSDFTLRESDGTACPQATDICSKEEEMQSNQNEAAVIINLREEVENQHQTSQSNTETEEGHCNISAPENLSTLTATEQSDEIVSETVTDQLTPDVTSISTPSFDDQDNRTNDSILNDQTESIERPADISVKEIGKFQIFNRKVDEDPTKPIDAVSNCPPKLQYDGSEETKTPLVLTQPTISEVPLTENMPMSIDMSKESKSSESTSSSSLIDNETTDKPEPLQNKSSSIEPATSNVDPMQQFPVSFKNTHINNRKRPLASKNDFDTDESSSESSEEEVEVKRQKTKPKFSHLAARKNAEIKRKATQIDCSTDEDEPVNKVQLKTISTELSKIENAAKQKKLMNDNSPIAIKMSKDDKPFTSTQTVHSASVTIIPPVQKEAAFSKDILESVSLVKPTPTFESNIIAVAERSSDLIMEEKRVSENAQPEIVNTNFSETATEIFVDRNQILGAEKSTIDVKVEEKPKDEMKITSVQENQQNEEIKIETNDNVKLNLTTKEEVKLKFEQEITSKDEDKHDKEICLKIDTPAIQNEATTKEETTVMVEVLKTVEVKSEQKIEKIAEDLTHEQMKKEVPAALQDDPMSISESETTQTEAQPAKPESKSKKPAADVSPSVDNANGKSNFRLS